MSLEDVHKALITAFQTAFPTWQATQVAWPNKAFQPPPAVNWMAWHFIPVTETIATLSAAGFDKCDGMLQIDLNAPIGGGEGTIRQTINELRSCFKPQVLLYGGQPVTILGRSASNGREMEGFYRTPFSVRWQAHIQRSA